VPDGQCSFEGRMHALAPRHRRLLRSDAMIIQVDSRFAGPPSMGHGGYVAGLFADGVGPAVQVTLRRPTPLDTPLDLARRCDGRGEITRGEDVIAWA
jgi:hypothetical protein